MVAAIVVLALNGLVKEDPENTSSQLVFYGEAAALVAFGVSWLTASRMLPVVTRKNERIALLH
jgi:anaerobic C4-dicarboxylate transporter